MPKSVTSMSPEAKLCANASRLAYATSRIALDSSSWPHGPLNLQDVYASNEAGNGVSVWSNDRYAVIAFKGTDNSKEVRCTWFQIGMGGGVNGQPFDIDKIYNKHCTGKEMVYITGHSLGGTRALHWGMKHVKEGEAEVHAFNPGSSLFDDFIGPIAKCFSGDQNTKTFVHHVKGDLISVGHQPAYGDIRYIDYLPRYANIHSIHNFVDMDFNIVTIRTDLPYGWKCDVMTYQMSDTRHMKPRHKVPLSHDAVICIGAEQPDGKEFKLQVFDYSKGIFALWGIFAWWGDHKWEEIVQPGNEYIILYLEGNWKVKAVKNVERYQRVNTDSSDIEAAPSDRRKLSMPQEGKQYHILNVESGKVLDVPKGNHENGAHIQLWEKRPSHGNQVFRFEKSGSHFHIMCKASGQALDVPKGNNKNGTHIQQWKKWPGNNQLFSLDESESSGRFRIVCKESGKVLEVPDGNNENGTHIQQWEKCLGNGNQLFRFEEV